SRAMRSLRTPHPNAVDEADDDGRPPREAAESNAIAVLDRLRTMEAARREMLQERQEKRQIGFLDALFIKGEDEESGLRVEQEVGILHPLGNALDGKHVADVVGREKG